MASSNGNQPAPPSHLPLPAATGGGVESHTFTSYLQLRKDGNCQILMHPILRRELPCICSKWRIASPASLAIPNTGQALEDPLPPGKLVLEGRTCLKCAEEICEMTQNLRDLSAIGNGGDKPLHHVIIAKNMAMFCHLITLVAEKGGHQAAVQALRETNERAETALHVAIIAGIRDFVLFMLWVDPQLARIASHDVSPIYLAVSLGHKVIAEVLHDALGPDAGRSCYSGPKGQNALFAAIPLGEDMIKTVLAWNTDKVLTGHKDENGNTPLHFAVSMEKYKRTMALRIFYPASLEKVRRPWLTRIFFLRSMVWVWRVPICWYILKAHPNMAYEPNNNGLVPVHIAAMSNQWADVDILRTNCNNCIFLRDNEGRTFLHAATQNNAFRIVNRVCEIPEFAPLMNIQDHNGNTALHLAVDAQNMLIVSVLLQNPNVSLNIRNDKGETALDLARSKIYVGYSENPDKLIYNMLEQVGAKQGSCRLEENADKREAEKEKQEKEASDKLTGATQTLGIGAVLIVTVTFGATFALPGGYRADDHVNGGTPTLAGPGRWYFNAFMVANTLAFICSSVATVGLMYSGTSLVSLSYRRVHCNMSVFFAASSITSLTAAFALAVYMVLAPVAWSTAIGICLISPYVLLYRNMHSLGRLVHVLQPILNRRGVRHAMMYAARALLLRALVELWPLALIFATAGR